MKEQVKSVYQFSGCWFDIFDMLVGIIKPTNAERFSVWESRKQTNGHLLITYGPRLTEECLQRYNLKQIPEPEFRMNYRSKVKEHIIHGYNEFDKKQ